jgi:pentatricopeptide repeat protein
MLAINKSMGFQASLYRGTAHQMRAEPRLHAAFSRCRPAYRPLALAPRAAVTQDDSKVRAEVTRRIKQLGRAGKAKEAVAELAQMARLCVQPDAQAATALLDACVRSSKMEMAEAVFAELFAELLTPDEVTFSVMLRGYGQQAPPRWTAISATLSSMEEAYAVRPTLVTFNALLDVCARTNDEARAAEIIDRMEAAGVQPDDFTVEAVKQKRSIRSMLKRKFLY